MNGEHEMKNDTALPQGKTCAQCVHVVRCVVLFGAKHTNTTCDFAPSRFQERGSTDAPGAVVEAPGGAAKRPYEKPEIRDLASGAGVELARVLGQLEGVEAAIEALEGLEEHFSAIAADKAGKALEQLASGYTAEVKRLRLQFEERKAP
jgi:hypothetical protein